MKSPSHLAHVTNFEVIRRCSPTNSSLFSQPQQRSSLMKQLIRSSQEGSIGSSQKEIRLSCNSDVPTWKFEKASQKTSSRKSSEAHSELEGEIKRSNAMRNNTKGDEVRSKNAGKDDELEGEIKRSNAMRNNTKGEEVRAKNAAKA